MLEVVVKQVVIFRGEVARAGKLSQHDNVVVAVSPSLTGGTPVAQSLSSSSAEPSPAELIN